MLEQLLPNDVFSLLLVFARIGSAVMLFPGFGEVFVPARARLRVGVEADHHTLGGDRQVHVGLRDRARGGVDHAHVDPLDAQVLQRAHQR